SSPPMLAQRGAKSKPCNTAAAQPDGSASLNLLSMPQLGRACARVGKPVLQSMGAAPALLAVAILQATIVPAIVVVAMSSNSAAKFLLLVVVAAQPLGTATLSFRLKSAERSRSRRHSECKIRIRRFCDSLEPQKTLNSDARRRSERNAATAGI